MAKEKVYGLTEKDAARVSRAVRGFEGGGGGAGGPSAAYGSWNPGVLRARVTVAIPAGTLASPSTTGKVRVRHKLLDGSWEEEPEETVLNDHAFCPGIDEIEVDKAVKVAWIDGDLWLIAADN